MYNPYNKEGWNDELSVGATESEPETIVEALVKDAQVDSEEDARTKKDKVERPMPRVTEADRSGDTRSLNRALARTLYLVVKGSNGGWGFPSGVLSGKESLQRVFQTNLAALRYENKTNYVHRQPRGSLFKLLV